MATKKEPEDDLEALLGEATVPEAPLEESQEAEAGPLKGVEPKSPPWGPEMFASAAYHRSRFAAEWNDRVAEADDETIAETFALASRLLKVMREELAARLAQ
jgi:hypothetical protein